MVLWRVSNYTALDGAGGLFAGGRWHDKGYPVVYCAENPATALLETLVHLEVDEQDLPSHYTTLKILVPDSVSVHEIDAADLPEDWQNRPWVTRKIGDRWLRSEHSPILAVPSALVPETRNFLINPSHPHSGRIEVVARIRHPLNRRFLA